MGIGLGQINKYDTFRMLEDNEFLPDTYQKIPYHMVLDVKFDLRRKTRLVAGGNWTEPPKEDVYSGVVSLDTIRLGFALSAMHNLSVCAGDVFCAFLYGVTKELTFVIAGPEFGPDVSGKRLVIYKGLYGLRSSAARFHEHLAANYGVLVSNRPKWTTAFGFANNRTTTKSSLLMLMTYWYSLKIPWASSRS